MAIGHYNHEEYIKKLNEEAVTHAGSNDGDIKGGDGTEGLIIPAENKKTYDWLKKEYNSAKTEVKVEMKMGGNKFEPGYDFQPDAGGKTADEFKPGMYGQVETSDTEGSKKKEGSDKKKKGASVQGAGVATVGAKKKDDAPKKESPAKEEPKKEEDEEKKEDKKKDKEEVNESLSPIINSIMRGSVEENNVAIAMEEIEELYGVDFAEYLASLIWGGVDADIQEISLNTGVPANDVQKAIELLQTRMNEFPE